MTNWFSVVSKSPPRPPIRHMAAAGVGAFAAIVLLGALQDASEHMWLMASFGASCLIVFALSDSPLAQPRHVIGGHLVAATTGLLVMQVLPVNMWSMALAVALAIVLMLVTRTAHPPAGANPLIVMAMGASWDFLLLPVLLGAVILVLVAWVTHRINRVPYPKYWY